MKCPELSCEELASEPSAHTKARHDIIICMNPTCVETGSQPQWNNWLIDPINTTGCRTGYMACMLCIGADPNAVAYGKWTALDMAARHCCVDQANILLGENMYNTKPANVNYQNAEGEAALHEAALCRPEDQNPSSCASTASSLLKHGADPNIKTKTGETKLMWALANNCPPDFIKLLLRNGADANAKDNNGKSVLEYAKGKPGMEELLKQYGAKK